jgi:hypothetical protein
MDNLYHLDLDAILNTVRGADVVAFRFVTVQERLLLDNRHSEVDPPMVKLVPKVNSAEERFKSLKVLRPRFKLPGKITAIWWPRYIDSLVETGVWGAIVQRMVDDGYPAAAAECDEVLGELRRMECDEMQDAIGGAGYRTLWPVSR